MQDQEAWEDSGFRIILIGNKEPDSKKTGRNHSRKSGSSNTSIGCSYIDINPAKFSLNINNLFLEIEKPLLFSINGL